MIFPNDVHRRTINSKKLLMQDKTVIIVELFLIANIACFFLFRFFFSNFLGLGNGWALVAQIVVFIAVGITIFRTVIFKEDEKMQELKDRQSDSFARYLHVRKDNIKQIVADKEHVSVFEYTNGCVTATMLFKFGSNDDRIANNTREVLQAIIHTICLYNFEFRTVTGPEIFLNSKEYKMHIAQINSVKDKRLLQSLRAVSNKSIKIANEESTADVFYLTIKSKAPGEQEQLEQIITEVLKLLKENITCFRSFEFLNIDSLLEFYRYFYGIEAIDLAMLKAIELSDVIDQDYAQLIKIYSLHSSDGKTYRMVDETSNQFATKERSIL